MAMRPGLMHHIRCPDGDAPMLHASYSTSQKKVTIYLFSPEIRFWLVSGEIRFWRNSFLTKFVSGEIRFLGKGNEFQGKLQKKSVTFFWLVLYEA